MGRTGQRAQVLTVEQQAIADRLARRATELRNAAEADGDHLTLREAIDVAALQLGYATPW